MQVSPQYPLLSSHWCRAGIGRIVVKALELPADWPVSNAFGTFSFRANNAESRIGLTMATVNDNLHKNRFISDAPSREPTGVNGVS
jgi:hypothetical protein